MLSDGRGGELLPDEDDAERVLYQQYRQYRSAAQQAGAKVLSYERWWADQALESARRSLAARRDDKTGA